MSCYIAEIFTLRTKFVNTTRKQNTLAEPVLFSGIGLHTCRKVTIRFCPAPANHGIVFKRIDLPEQTLIPAVLESVCDASSRSTTLGIGSVRIHTVEHVLSALRAYDIDNAIVEISDIEPPVADGSSLPFVQMIEQAGIKELAADCEIAAITKPLYYQKGDVYLVALPSDVFKVSYTLSYPGSPILQAQYHSAVITSEYFKREIASSRTFSLYEEIEHLIDRGLIKGGSLSNSVIIKDNAILSHEGLRYSNEMVRHKILDLIGDLSLVMHPFKAHIIAAKSGHQTNYEFAKVIYEHITTEKQ